MMKNYTLWTLAILATLCISSCTEYDYGFNEKSIQYSEDFKKEFGDIDPNQDWSMATRVRADINVEGATSSSCVEIYTDKPIYATSRMLSKQNINTSNISFDVKEGAKQVFAVVRNDDKVLASGYFDVTEGMVFISDKSLPVRDNGVAMGTRAVTRAASKGYSESLYMNNHTISIQHLSNVERSAAEPWSITNIAKIMGPGSFFAEYGAYYGSTKYPALYDATTLANIEKGFAIKTTGGVIELPFVYGATQNHCMFGYVYYKDGQDPLTQPHYVLIDDANPNKNLYFNAWKGNSSEQGVDDMALANWNSYENPNPLLWNTKNEDLVYGTTYKLTYFGENHDQSGVSSFPAGYNIAFFVCPKNGETANTWTYNYSLPSLNKEIGHTYGYSTNNLTKDSSRGAVKAAAWTSGGSTFLGFEDGVDDDLNDIVFWIEGGFTPTADSKPINLDGNVEYDVEPVEWIVACEDLGSIGDNDFNDVVFGVKHYTEACTINGAYIDENGQQQSSGTVNLNNYLIFTPLAAGGSYKADIYFNDRRLGEIHELLGYTGTVKSGFLPFINTEKYTADGTPIVIDLGSTNFSMVPSEDSESMSGFRIVITKEDNSEANSYVIMSPKTGNAPQMLLMSANWMWSKERVPIQTAYSGFTNWIHSASENSWDNYYASGCVIVRPKSSGVHITKPTANNSNTNPVVTPGTTENSEGTTNDEVNGGNDNEQSTSNGNMLSSATTVSGYNNCLDVPSSEFSAITSGCTLVFEFDALGGYITYSFTTRWNNSVASPIGCHEGQKSFELQLTKDEVEMIKKQESLRVWCNAVSGGTPTRFTSVKVK